MLYVAWTVVAVMVLIGAGLLVFGLTERRWYAAFSPRAVRAQAVVTGASRRSAAGTGHGTSRPPSWLYRTHVRFAGPDGRAVEARVRYPVATRPRLGEAIEVHYDPRRPGRVVLPGTRPPGALATSAVGGAVLVAAYLAQAIVRTFA